MKIEYHLVYYAYKRYHARLRELAQRPEIVKVCDIGGGANPLLSTEEITKYGLDYTLLEKS